MSDMPELPKPPEPPELPKPPEASEPPKPSDSSSEPGQPSRPRGPKLWRPSDSQQTQAPGGRRRDIWLAFALLLALLGAVAAWVLFPSPVAEPSFLGIWIDQYNDERVPVNAWAEQDRVALKAVPWRSVNAFSNQQGNLLKQVLSELREQKAEPAVLFLCAYAATREDGSVCILPGDARLEDESTWLPLSTVLQFLRGCPAPHKLLVLDLMRPFTAPRLGLLTDDVPARVQAELENAVREDKRLSVLWACGPGQHSLVAPELGHSAFAYYLREGLRGAADGWTEEGRPGPRDARISARELAAFVRARVDRWSEGTRDTRQTPQLLGKDDFALVNVADRPASAAPQPPAVPVYPKWLAAAWQTRDAWWNEGRGRVPPLLLGKLEATLLRAERRFDAGHNLTEVETALARKLKELEAQRQRWRDALPPPGKPSLARELAQGKPPPDLAAVLPKYRALLALADKLQAAAKPAEKDVERLEGDKAALLKQFDGKPFELAWLAFDTAVKDLQPAQERVRFVAKLLAAATPAPAYQETALLQRLAEWKVGAKDWPAPAVRLALDLAKKTALAEADADDVRLLPWAKHRLAAARAARAAADGLLFKPGEAAEEDVAAALNGALREYQAAAGQLRTLADAHRLLADALVRLPAYAAYLEAAPGEERGWAQAAAAALALQARLAEPPANAAQADDAVRKIGKLTDTLREELNATLVAEVEARAAGLIAKGDKAGAADWVSMDALLRLAWLNAKDRVNLWAAVRQVSARLTAKVLEKDRNDDTDRVQSPPPAVNVAAGAERERKLALLRARIAPSLLRLAGAAELTGVEAAVARVEREPQQADAWRALGRELRQAWAKVTAAEAGENVP